jgi:GT2 family glycosyltransferase
MSELRVDASDVTIVILTRNRVELASRCLESVFSQVSDEVPVIVLVNGSDDDSVSTLGVRFPRAQIVEASENLGCPGGRNFGIKLAPSPWVLCLDDDGWIPPGVFSSVLKAIRTHPDAAVIAGVAIEYPGAPVSAREGPAGLFSGGICVVNREVFLAMGGYHEDGLRQGEETELAIRIHDQDWLIWRDPSLTLVHPFDHSSQKKFEILRTGTRQMILTALKLCPLYALPGYLAWRWSSFFAAGLRERMLPAIYRGTFDAVRSAPKALRARKAARFSSLRKATARV